MKVLSTEIQVWIKSTYFPESIKTGLKHLAFIVPKSAMAKMSMSSANKEMEQESPVEIKYFSSEDEALAWIKSVQ